MMSVFLQKRCPEREKLLLRFYFHIYLATFRFNSLTPLINSFQFQSIICFLNLATIRFYSSHARIFFHTRHTHNVTWYYMHFSCNPGTYLLFLNMESESVYYGQSLELESLKRRQCDDAKNLKIILEPECDSRESVAKNYD